MNTIDVALICKALGDSNRLQIIQMLSDGEKCGCKLLEAMAEVIGVSEAQLRFVTNTASGMGLIKCGSVVIPFDNQISKDTDLYRLYNTNIHEKIAEQKKKEAMLQ